MSATGFGLLCSPYEIVMYICLLNSNPVMLTGLQSFWKTFWRIDLGKEWTGNLILGGTEIFCGTYMMSFLVGIGSLGGTLFFQVGLCTPLQIIHCLQSFILLFASLLWSVDVKNSHKNFIVLKNHPRPNLKVFQYHNWTQ